MAAVHGGFGFGHCARLVHGSAWQRHKAAMPGAAAALAKVTGVIVTVRVALRRAGGAEHPPI